MIQKILPLIPLFFTSNSQGLFEDNLINITNTNGIKIPDYNENYNDFVWIKYQIEPLCNNIIEETVYKRDECTLDSDLNSNYFKITYCSKEYEFFIVEEYNNNNCDGQPLNRYPVDHVFCQTFSTYKYSFVCRDTRNKTEDFLHDIPMIVYIISTVLLVVLVLVIIIKCICKKCRKKQNNIEQNDIEQNNIASS